MDRFIGHGKDCGFYPKGVTGSLQPGNLAYVVKIPIPWRIACGLGTRPGAVKLSLQFQGRWQWPGPGSQQVLKSKWSWHMF